MGKVINELSKNNIKMNITAVYTHNQTAKILSKIKKNKSYYINICWKSWRCRKRSNSRNKKKY